MKKKVILSIFVAMFVSIMSLTNVLAVTSEVTIKGNTSKFATFAEALAAAKDKDTIVIGEGTLDIGTATIDKVLYIEGSGRTLTTLTGNFVVTKDFTLKSLELTTSASGAISIEIIGKSVVKLDDLKLINTAEKDILKITSGGSGTNLNLENSELIGKYGLKVRAENTTVRVDGTTISAYGAFDIAASVRSNGGKPYSNNKLTVENSTLLGINNYATSLNNNEYAVVTIAGQKDGIFNFTNCTIKNEVSTEALKGNAEVLIDLNNTYYMANENTKVTVTDSKLINTDKTHDSYVLNTGALTSGKNELVLSGNTTTTPEGKYSMPIVDGTTKYFTVTVRDFEKGEKLITVKENEKLAKLTPELEKGYTFDAWYLGEAKYDFETPITKDITIEAKYTKNPETPVTPAIPNPGTGDNIVLYIVMGSIGVISLGIAVYYLLKSKNSKK